MIIEIHFVFIFITGLKMANRQSNQLPLNLPQLQNLVKRDPESYKQEFLQQKDHFDAVYDAFVTYYDQRNDKYNEEIDKLMTFLAQVAHCYTEELTGFPQKLMDALEKHAWEMHADNRMSICRTLILLRNKNLLEPMDLLPLFFKLFQCPDKRLRKCLQQNIIADIKNMNIKRRNNKLNTYLQNFMFQMVNNSHAKTAKISLNIMVELYHKNVWNDAKCVNVIAEACLSKIPSVMITAVKFFLTSNVAEKEDGSDSEDDIPNPKEMMMANRVNKKTRKREKNLDKLKTLVKKKKKKQKTENFQFSALHLIYDPQGFAEKLFKQMSTLHDQFEGKLLTLELISRLIGVHELILLNFYPYLSRFLRPHQREVTKILQCVAQAAHQLVPPENLESVVEVIVNNFVTERNSADVMAVGINAIREICLRCPLSMNRDMLQDLSSYKSYREKSVMMAARSLIHLFRDANPELLQKRDKGKPTIAAVEKKAKGFGELDAVELIPGAEALVGNDGEEAEDDDGVDSDSSGEWINLSDSENEANGSDEEVDDEEEEDEDDDDNDEEEDGDDSGNEDAESEENKNEKAKEKKNPKKKSKKEPEEEGLDPQARRLKALELIQTQILTDEDFKRMEKLQMQKQVVGAKKGSAKKRKASEAIDHVSKQIDELVDLGAIENIHKRKRHDREARLEAVKKGQEGREKFGKKKGRMNPHASTTNKEKRKSKAFMMLKPKLKRKGKSSVQERQRSFKHWLEKTRKRMLKLK
ncbi:Protein SDA1 [Orchesella cincta]|uniref:Protein SDA1 n=1 Tax=Orchesella cincta TaxID=48709 RepID=A0A1D2MXR8_ORCCI|nr:Protein SDA1 [Orchesella cincta]